MIQDLLPEAAPNHLLDYFLTQASLDVDRAIENFRAHRKGVFTLAPAVATSGSPAENLGAANPITGQGSTGNNNPSQPPKAKDKDKDKGKSKNEPKGRRRKGSDKGSDDGDDDEPKKQRPDPKDPFNPPSDDDDDSENDDDKPDKVRFRYNNESQRRRIAVKLRDRIAEKFSDAKVTPAEAMLLLVYYQWDYNMIVAMHEEFHHMKWRLYHRFERMKLPIVIKDKDTNDQKAQKIREQDERLVTLIEATGRSDYEGLWRFLDSLQWDLLAAITQWFNEGIEPYQRKPKKGKKSVEDDLGLRRDTDAWPVPPPPKSRSKAPPKDDEWDAGKDTFEPSDDDEPDYDSEEEYMIQNPAKHDPTPLINEDRSIPMVGEPDLTKLVIQGIQNGRYIYRRFDNGFTWPNLNKAVVKPRKNQVPRNEPFDWYRGRSHLSLLTKWRAQVFARRTGQGNRPASQPWSDEENKFLYDLTEQEVTRLEKKTKKNRDQLLPLTVSQELKDEWARKFNAKFSGTTPAGAKKPRYDRGPHTLMTQRNRLREMIQDFKCKEDALFFARKAKADKNREAAERAEKSDVPSEDEEEGEKNGG